MTRSSPNLSRKSMMRLACSTACHEQFSPSHLVSTRPMNALCDSDSRLQNEPVAVSGSRCVHRSEEHTSELQSLMRISYAVFCLKKKKNKQTVYLLRRA